ncbi:MAG: imidazole glycerol phosphate synthase subunit HisH, partial [Planctomycetes bacterium]|nr:imidazole glycerol phosphate synthase subunit HisH [Planctomycetota bacterium]
MIVVIDYNVGNVRSVCNALQHIGCDAQLSRDPAELEKAAGLVLPGVAAFGYAMEALGAAAEPVKKAAATGKPILGICVGHQLLFDESCEYGPHRGLGLVQGKVVPIPPQQTVPHMGWNLVELPEDMD